MDLHDTPPMDPEDVHRPPITRQDGAGSFFPPAPPSPPAPPAAETERPRPRPPRWRAAAAIGALALAAGGAGGWIADATSGSQTKTVSVAVPASVKLSGGALDVAGVVASLQPSVVSIETEIALRQGRWASTGRGAGTGVVIDTGLILTNAHVVEGATSVTVTGADGKVRPATIVASDSTADIALVRVADSSGLVKATLGTGKAVHVGDDVVAIGNALALEGGLTVTRGIVSALNRSIDAGNESLTGLVQTDAAISSGNSGGALVNAAGQVIGINTAVASSDGTVTASNIGFAISIDRAMAVADRLLASHP